MYDKVGRAESRKCKCRQDLKTTLMTSKETLHIQKSNYLIRLQSNGRVQGRDPNNNEDHRSHVAACPQESSACYNEDIYIGSYLYNKDPHGPCLFILPEAYSLLLRSMLANYQPEARHTLHALDSNPDATC